MQDEEGRSSHSHSPHRSHQHLKELQAGDESAASTEALQIEEGAELAPPLGETTAQQSGYGGDSSSPIQPPARAPILLPSLIIPFAILGLLIRLGLVWIETFSGQQVFALAWPQFIGYTICASRADRDARIVDDRATAWSTPRRGYPYISA
ncbi:hypothetical protein BGX34_005725 [Mortierella sp. NVP85]|nr:hypothetical protein BGX34_005725 [Mortierella sp. NVP85]